MLNALIVVAIVGQFAVYELFLLLRVPFGLSAYRLYADDLQRRAVRKIFSIFNRYRGFKPYLENRLGVELPERFVIVSNHQSLIDIPVFWYLLPSSRSVRFVAKRELGMGIPLVSTLLHVQGHGLVSRRGNMVQAMKSLERYSRRSRKDGSCPVIFPEGTRSRTGELGTFHTAGFRRMMEIDPLPVLVAAIDGGSWVATLGGFFGNLGKYSYKVRFAALLAAPRGKKEALATLAKSHEIVESALSDMRSSGPAKAGAHIRSTYEQ